MYRRHPYRGSRGAAHASGAGASSGGAASSSATSNPSAAGSSRSGGSTPPGGTPPSGGAAPPTPPAPPPAQPAPAQPRKHWFHRALDPENRTIRWAVYITGVLIFLSLFLWAQIQAPESPSAYSVFEWVRDHYFLMIIVFAALFLAANFDIPETHSKQRKSLLMVLGTLATLLFVGAVGVAQYDKFTEHVEDSCIFTPDQAVHCTLYPAWSRNIYVDRPTHKNEYRFCVHPEVPEGTRLPFETNAVAVNTFQFRSLTGGPLPVVLRMVRTDRTSDCPRDLNHPYN